MKPALAKTIGLFAAAAVAAALLPDIAVWTGASALTVVPIVLAALALWTLPGLALLALLWPDRDNAKLTSLERLTLGMCLSLIAPPLLLLLTSTLGLRWNSAATWLVLIASAIFVVRSSRQLPQPSWHMLAFGGMSVLLVFARLHLVRDLPAGLLGDSYHHTVITQLLVDNGGLFTSWEPYAPMTTFTYHFGFHANAAFLHWLTGIPVVKATLFAGQIQGVLAMAAAYVLVSYAITAKSEHAPDSSRAALAGLFAAALVGFVNPMPATFVNWGRYTQQAGHIVLPALVVCWMRLIEQPKMRGILLCALATAGIMLTHYIVTAFAALCVLACILFGLVRQGTWRNAGKIVGAAVLTACGALLLTSPWLINTFGGFLVRNTSGFVNGAVTATRIAQYAALPPLGPPFLNILVVYAAGIGGLLSLATREWRVTLLAVFSGLIVLTVVPHVIGLPGTGVIDSLAAYIALYATLAPLAGYGIATAIDWVAARLRFDRRLPAVLSVATLAGFSIWGVGWQRGMLTLETTQLLTTADANAMLWIRTNTPPQAHFLVNAFPAFGGTLLAGSDGGWWLPYLGDRKSSLPPITYGSERGVSDKPAVRDSIVGLWEKLRGKPIRDTTPIRIDVSTPENIVTLRAYGITHIYDGANPEPRATEDWLDTTPLRKHPDFRLIYEKDNVRIFEMR